MVYTCRTRVVATTTADAEAVSGAEEKLDGESKRYISNISVVQLNRSRSDMK